MLFLVVLGVIRPPIDYILLEFPLGPIGLV